MALIRVVVVDDHPAMRAGIRAVLDGTPDIALVGEAADAQELIPVLQKTAPDVVLLDFHLPGDDGLAVCYRLKRFPLAPKVVLYSAYADQSLVAPAMLAQSDALIAKRASAGVVCQTLRDVAGETAANPPALPAAQRERLTELLDPEDIGLAGLLLLRSAPADITRATGLQPAELTARVEDLLRRVTERRGDLA